MSNPTLSNKPKPARPLKGYFVRKQAVARKPSGTKPDASSFNKQFWVLCTHEPLEPGSPAESDYQLVFAKLAKQHVTHDFEQLAEGAVKLAQLVLFLSHADPAPKGAQSRSDEVNDFKAAYASIVRSVPEARRPQLLRDMRAGIEEAAKAELASASTTTVGSGGDAPVSTRDFMAGLERQEIDQRARDTDEGRLVPGAVLAARLNMTPQGLHHALKAKRIFTLQGPSGEKVYPAFFADPRQDRKMLEKVSKALGDLPGAAKWDFFMSPRESLGKRTPLEALAKGRFEAVMVAANAFAEE